MNFRTCNDDQAPPASQITDPFLCAEIHCIVKACKHLKTQECSILLTVSMLNMPSTDYYDMLPRMLPLHPTQFQLLAKIFEAGFGVDSRDGTPSPNTEDSAPTKLCAVNNLEDDGLFLAVPPGSPESPITLLEPSLSVLQCLF